MNEKTQIKNYLPYYNLPPLVTNKWVSENMLSKSFSFRATWHEVLEIFEELFQGNFSESIKEAHQVYYCILLLAYSKLNICFPMIGCMSIVKAHAKRFNYWAILFDKYNISWSTNLFQDGTNWQRPHKIISTLERANISISTDTAQKEVQYLKQLSA